MLKPAIPKRCAQQLRDSRSTRIRTDSFANGRDNQHHKNVEGPTPNNAECELILCELPSVAAALFWFPFYSKQFTLVSINDVHYMFSDAKLRTCFCIFGVGGA